MALSMAAVGSLDSRVGELVVAAEETGAPLDGDSEFNVSSESDGSGPPHPWWGRVSSSSSSLLRKKNQGQNTKTSQEKMRSTCGYVS